MKNDKQEEKILVRKNKILRLDILMVIILAIVILDLQFFGVYGETFFRDFPIIFEGSYRINSGQVPYQDFYLPMGPIVFYMQAFFDILLGSNLFSMTIHAFIVSFILSVIFYFIVRKELPIFFSWIFAIFLYLSFEGLTFHPFYNQASYFFFFINIFLLFKYRKKEEIPKFIYLISAILAVLAFYSKQDVGLLHIFFILIYSIFNYHKQWKSILVYYLIPSIVMLVLAYLSLSNLSGFQYWFNIGQPPHDPRIKSLISARSIFGVVTAWKFYTCLFFIYLLLYSLFKRKIKTSNPAYLLIKHNSAIKLVSLFIVVAATTLITQSTSGLTNNSLSMGEPVLIFILFLLIKENTNFLKKQDPLIITYFLVIILVLVVNPFAVYGQILLNYTSPKLKRVDQGCYKGILMPESVIDGLETIREAIEKNDKDFFSMTEYTFLYCDYNLIPPRNVSLWFDEGISFFAENVQDIIKVVNSSKPKIILLQDPHRNEDKNLINKFEKEFSGLGYTRIGIADAAASYGKTYYSLGYTKTEVIKIEKTEAPIIILIRNDLITQIQQSKQ